MPKRMLQGVVVSDKQDKTVVVQKRSDRQPSAPAPAPQKKPAAKPKRATRSRAKAE